MTLILLRHAKSSWADPMEEDHERPLNRRGREAAQRLGTWLKANGHVPKRLLVSSAVRAQETAERLRLPVPIETRPALYMAAPETILACALEERDAPVLILGHNPGMAEAAARACAAPPRHPDFDRYPTAACTVIDRSAGLPGKAIAFVVPRDLPAA